MASPRRGRALTAARNSADDRIPFPRTQDPTPCQDNPAMFAFEEFSDPTERDPSLARAKLACSGCTVVHGCLQWALANPALTRRGVWAATTPRIRARLRQRLVQRLGDDWVGIVANSNRRRAPQRQASRTASLTPRQEILTRLELELIPTRPEPYEPHREPMTPRRQALNRRILQRAITDRTPRQSLPKPQKTPVHHAACPEPAPLLSALKRADARRWRARRTAGVCPTREWRTVFHSGSHLLLQVG